jgi:hypothetical protein
METTFSRVRVAMEGLRPYLRFRPHSGRLWLDLILLLVVGALHHTVLPSLTRSLVPIDLMTPWLVTVFVLETLPRAALLALFGALIVETHTAAPAGLYIVAYWVILVALYLTRGTLSWRHAFPWVVTFLLSQAWVIGFETFVLSVSSGGFPFGIKYVVSQVARLLISVPLGLLLCQHFMVSGLHEETA